MHACKVSARTIPIEQAPGSLNVAYNLDRTQACPFEPVLVPDELNPYHKKGGASSRSSSPGRKKITLDTKRRKGSESSAGSVHQVIVSNPLEDRRPVFAVQLGRSIARSSLRDCYDRPRVRGWTSWLAVHPPSDCANEAANRPICDQGVDKVVGHTLRFTFDLAAGAQKK